MKKELGKALFFWGIALLILFVICPIQDAENLYSSVIRIHVLANSDSPEDQQLKLLVRDKILDYTAGELSFSGREEAEEVINEHLNQIKAVAEKTLEEAGNPMSVSVSLTEESYPTREYETLSLPAGEYASLQVKIGDAEGQNWWCVLFPPLCLNSAVETEDALLEAGMDEDNVRTVTRDGTNYRIRFKILEIWQGAKVKIKEIF